MNTAAIKRYLYNLRGKAVREKLVLFESDDWGMVRTRSTEAYRILAKDFPLDRCDYSWRDALERKKDLEGLLEVLSGNTSAAGSKPSFTLNMVMFNPEFDAIRGNGYSTYVREPFERTYERYDGPASGTVELLREGIGSGHFQPQYHATEHIQINNWMDALNRGDAPARTAFANEMPHLHYNKLSTCSIEYLDAWGHTTASRELESRPSIVSVGLSAFRQFFGYPSKTAIAPCYIWGPDTETALIDGGVQGFQGGTVQKLPLAQDFGHVRHHMGERGGKGQRYFIRNCSFEFGREQSADIVGTCLREIAAAFRLRKPAVISSHRVNYIGRLDESNRDNGLRQLDQLLKSINKRWPDVRYVSSPELLEYY